MELSFSDVERALALIHTIDDRHRSAFSARLKNFQRMGFPAGVNTGRGRAATYGVGHLIQLGLALELSQLGLAPERAVSLLQGSIRTVAGIVLVTCVESINDAVNIKPYGMYFDPRCLGPLMAQDLSDDPSIIDRIFGWTGSGMLPSTPDNDTAGALLSTQIPRFAFVSVSSLMNQLARQIDITGEQHRFYPAAQEWAHALLNEIQAVEAEHGNDPQA